MKRAMREIRSWYYLLFKAAYYLHKAKKAKKFDIKLSEAYLRVAMEYQRISRE
jgi:hypothetical protein